MVGQHGPLGRPGTGQHLLGQRRPVVGEVELLADQDEPAGEAVGPRSRLGGPRGRPATAPTTTDRCRRAAERAARQDRGDGPADVRTPVAAHRPNMASHSAAERGRKTKLWRRISPIGGRRLGRVQMAGEDAPRRRGPGRAGWSATRTWPRGRCPAGRSGRSRRGRGCRPTPAGRRPRSTGCPGCGPGCARARPHVAHRHHVPAVVGHEVLGPHPGRRAPPRGPRRRWTWIGTWTRSKQRGHPFDRPAGRCPPHVVGVVVGGQHADTAHVVGGQHVQQVVDRVGRVDDQGLAGLAGRPPGRRS